MDKLPQEYQDRISVDAAGCWIWTGARSRDGYGRYSRAYMHRAVYEILVGAIPEGLDIDHLCRVHPCCNPEHLEPVTRRENLIRGETSIARQVAATACPQGHAYDEVNTYWEGEEAALQSVSEGNQLALADEAAGEGRVAMDKTVFAVAQRHFGDLGPQVVATMYGIAMAESGGNPNAYNPNGLDRSHGLWQINIHPAANPDLAHMNLKDPDQNGRAARIIYDRQGLKAWTTYTGGHYRAHTNEVFGIKGTPKAERGDMPERDEDYQYIANQIAAYIGTERALGQLMLEVSLDLSDPNRKSPAVAMQELRDMGIAGTPEENLMQFGTATPAPVDIIRKQQDGIRATLQELYAQAAANNEYAAATDFGQYITQKNREDLFPSLFGNNQGFAPAPYQFQILDNGDLLVMNPNTGTMENKGNFPNAVQKTVSQDRRGNLIAYDPYTRQTEVLVPDFGFPELDPMLSLRTETLLSAARVEADWAGVELAARGQQLEAIAQDDANKILTGRMVYEESRLNLDRYDRALTQRRDERQQVLDYGVTRESLRTLPSGEVVTTLPFAKQTSEILNRFIPGGGLSESDFQLGVSYINPDQSAGDLMRGSAYDSPLPGIISGLQSNKALTDSILANTPQQSGAAGAAVAGVM